MIIVTGGAGFIGSNLVKGLNDMGEEKILIVDNLTRASKHLNLNRLRYSDYLDKELLPDKLESLPKPKVIFHQGACSDTTESDGRYMMANNYEYSKILLHFAMEQKIPFLYASSASVYGNGTNGFAENPEAEYPLNVYGFSKFSFDNYVRRLLPEAESQILGLRYFNVYGPQESHKGRMASVAFHLFHQLRKEGSMKLFEGSEGFRRDFIHVQDTVKINLHFLHSGKSGIFNAGTGQARSFTAIGKCLKNIEGSGELKSIPFPEDLRGKYQEFTEADTTQLREAGYQEEFLSLEEGIRIYHGMLKENGGFHL